MVALIADLVVEVEINTPGADSIFPAQVVSGLRISAIMIAGVEQLPIDEIVATFKAPR